jgi:activator of HSP90 ATPase
MKNISQIVLIPAAPNEVYESLMNEKKHAGFTGAAAKIDNRVSGEFEVWDGYATGRNIELIPGKKIVQTWRASDWPEGQESEITIELSEKDGQTELKFNQKNIPDDFAADVEQGWQDFYWQPMIQYLKKR